MCIRYCRTLYHLRLSERRSGTVTVMINQLLLQQLILGWVVGRLRTSHRSIRSESCLFLVITAITRGTGWGINNKMEALWYTHNNIIHSDKTCNHGNIRYYRHLQNNLQTKYDPRAILACTARCKITELFNGSKITELFIGKFPFIFVAYVIPCSVAGSPGPLGPLNLKELWGDWLGVGGTRGSLSSSWFLSGYQYPLPSRFASDMCITTWVEINKPTRSKTQ